jgi:type IV pilus assembly protein PilW
MQEERNRSSGFSLVEMMVVVAISGVVFAGVLNVFTTSNTAYLVQQEIAALQQNIRVSKMFLGRDIRMAGFGLNDFSMGDQKLYAFTFDNDTTDGDAGSDKLTIRYLDIATGGCGESGTGTPEPCSDLPPLTLKATMPLNAAEAEVNEDLTTAPYSAWDDDCWCGKEYTQPQPGFAIIITSPDGTKSDVVFLTGTQPNSDKIQNGPNFTADDGITYENKVLNSYPAGSTISFFNLEQYTEVTYNLVDGVLMRNSQPIAGDIDDLQFAFGLDTDGDTYVDSWVNDADLTDTQKTQVRLVRVNVLGRTESEHRGYSDTRQALEDNGAASSSDGYRRKLLQWTVKARNLG